MTAKRISIRTILSVALILVASVACMAQTHWTCNPNDYRYDMTMYAVVQIEEDTVNPQTIEFAAFVGDECRGVAEAFKLPDDTYIYYLRIRSNASTGETYKFKACMEDGKVIEVFPTEDFTFAAESMLGVPSNPFKFTGKLYTLGDVNDDGKINVFDIAAVRMYILKRNPSKFIFEAADVDGNGKINVFDIANIRKLILNK